VLRLYDTQTRQVEPVEPAHPGALRMYTCGPAVHHPVHVGHLRSYLLADLIRRSAAADRLRVVSCLGIPDVGPVAEDSGPGLADGDPGLAGGDPGLAGGDPAIARAGPEGTGPLELARRHEAAFRADCAALNIYPADHSPRASESIGFTVELIGRLLRAGHAYQAPGGSVYFDARSYPGYGQLSGSRLADPGPGHQPGGEGKPGQRFHADWALWHGAAPGRELTWDAPWGTGFPGWHIECSAMSLHFLGEQIDVHTGGIDLRFPHHEDERAQSDCVTGHTVVRHWVHGARLLFEGRKMARATQNVVLLGDLPARGLDPLALRLAFLEHHYRQPVNLSWEGLRAADTTLRRWRQRVAEWARSPSGPLGDAAREITGAFEADVDTPAALRVLRRLERASDVPPGTKFETFAHADQLLGLDLARDVGRDPIPPLPPPAPH
jgi:cysteinyl-tRNA synthetase